MVAHVDSGNGGAPLIEYVPLIEGNEPLDPLIVTTRPLDNVKGADAVTTVGLAILFPVIVPLWSTIWL